MFIKLFPIFVYELFCHIWSTVLNRKANFLLCNSWQLPLNELIIYLLTNFFFYFSRADTRSEARSYNETIIRPVTRRLNTPAGTSYRSSRSHATTSEVNISFLFWIKHPWVRYPKENKIRKNYVVYLLPWLYTAQKYLWMICNINYNEFCST